MILPSWWYELLESAMDKWRPGWRERGAKRKSPWDAVGLVLGIAILLPAFGYFLFRVAWALHVYFYPAHAGHLREFWGDGISFPAFASSFLMAMPLLVPALFAGLLASNVLMWLIVPARRAMEREAAGDPELTFRGANIGLIKIGVPASVICIVLSFIGVATLHSLH